MRVHNSGTVDGKGVVVRLSVNTPMGMGDHGTFVPLPDSAPQDVPAGGFHDFVFEWYPTGHGHTCLLAQIVTHATALSDLDLTNNQTQENIDDFSPSSASPYPPTDFTFTVNSRYDRPMKVRLNPTGLVDGMDLEVEAPVFVVPANGTIKLKGRLKLDVAKIPPNHKERRLPLRFNLHALRATRDAWLPYGGISVDVNPGYTSSLKLGEVRKAERGIVIEGVLKGPFPSGQKIDAAIVARDGKSYGGTAVTSASGVFQITVVGPPRGPARAMLYYFGPDMAYSTVGPQAIVVP